jgi:hypothetical protein
MSIDDQVNLENRKIFDISLQDRNRLRKIVKKIHMRHFPAESVTNREADKIIESLGPKIQEHLIKKYIDQVR